MCLGCLQWMSNHPLVTFRFWDGNPSEVTEAAEQLKERERLIKDWACHWFFLCTSGSDTILGKRNDKPFDLIRLVTCRQEL